MPQPVRRSVRRPPFPVIEDVSDFRLAGGWLKMQLALLHASSQERSLKIMSFEDYKRAFILKPPEEKMEPSVFIAQDLQDQTSFFAPLKNQQSRGGFRSMRVGFGSSAPTGREPIQSKAAKTSVVRLSRYGESKDFWRTDEFEDHSWESWGGLTTRQIRNTPLFKQFAMEHPTIFNDLFTPAPKVDSKLLDPEKGFQPRVIKYGLGIPGVAMCKKSGETDGRFKGAYETTSNLISSGRIDSFRDATAMKRRTGSISRRSSSNRESGEQSRKDVSRNRYHGPPQSFQALKTRKSKELNRGSLKQQLDEVEAEVESGGFDFELNGNVNYTHTDFLRGCDNGYSLQRALSLSEQIANNHRDMDEPLIERPGNISNYSLCSRAAIMEIGKEEREGEGLIDGVEKRTYNSFDIELPCPRKGALKSSRPTLTENDEEEKPAVKEERRARFAGISSSPSNTPTTE